jgi:transposase
VRLLRLHFVEKAPVSKVCEEAGIAPTQFYRWQKDYYEKGSSAFESSIGRRRNDSLHEEQVRRLKEKLQRKDEVLSELMEEYVALKKSLGGT